MKNDSELNKKVSESVTTKKTTESGERRVSTKKKEEVGPGRYWGIVILLLTVVASLLFRFFS